MSFVYYEGAFIPKEEAKIPLTDRGFLFGDGAYATIRVEQGSPHYLETHLEQLEAQTRSFNLLMPKLSSHLVDELIRLNHAEEGIWRLKVIVTGGDEKALFLPRRSGRILMTLNPYTPLPFKPLKMGIFPYPFHLCHASYKSLAHLNRFYVMQAAKEQGVDDCLTVTEKGIVLEAAFGNLLWMIEKELFTPSSTLPLYFGVTLRKLIEAAKEQGYRVHEVEMTLDELPSEGRYFRTSSMSGVCPITELGALKLKEGAHPLSALI